MDLKQHIQDLTLSVTNGHASAADTYALLYGLKKTIDECLQVLRIGRTLQPEIHMMYEHDKYCLNDDEVAAS